MDDSRFVQKIWIGSVLCSRRTSGSVQLFMALASGNALWNSSNIRYPSLPRQVMNMKFENLHELSCLDLPMVTDVNTDPIGERGFILTSKNTPQQTLSRVCFRSKQTRLVLNLSLSLHLSLRMVSRSNCWLI